MALIGVVLAAILAGMTGYLIRRRTDRSAQYDSLIETFLKAAHAGALVVSLGIQQGESFYATDNPKNTQNHQDWADWGQAHEAFQVAVARLRRAGSRKASKEAQKLKEFLETNINGVRPVTMGVDAKVGPHEIDVEAERLASVFADRVR